MQASFYLQRELQNNVVCGRIRDPYFIPHFHSHIELYLILSGEVEVLVNDQKRLLRAGELSVAFSYDTHSYRTPVEAEAIYLIIPTSFCGQYGELLSGRALSSPFVCDQATYQTVLQALEGLLVGGNELTRQGLIYVILGAIYDRMLPKSAALPTPNRVNTAEILIYLSRHFRESLSLGGVAREFGYNESYFSRYFRQTFGISFVRYLAMLRLREAVLLMQAGDRTVTACALESGFGSIRSFYRAFEEEFGCSPSEYWRQTEGD